MMRAGIVVIFMLGVLPHAFQSNAEAQQVLDNTFPQDFLFGVATSAAQYEGAWNESDKGQSVWDYMTHSNPELTMDGSTIDVANDFYHKYKEDIRRARSIGTQMFRLSLSWTRILPNGFINQVSNEGVKFYKNLLDEILASGMTPMVVIFHWDLPFNLQKLGGLSNSMFVDWFEQYARFVFSTFGDKVKFWVTVNEPNLLCGDGYGDRTIIPALNLSGIADYMCAHHVLLAHARAYRLYGREFRARQNGKVGIINNFSWFEPSDTSSSEDVLATERTYQWYNYWLVDPIFSSTGDYPRVIKERVGNFSRAQGFAASRLPRFTDREIRDLRGSADFLGLNYEVHQLVKAQDPRETAVSLDNDAGLLSKTLQMQIAPWAFANLVRRISKDYNRPAIYITEDGFPDVDGFEDAAKTMYLHGHLAEVLKAIQDGVDIRGYIVWSLLDCFEWQNGYRPKFGLFRVDFNSKSLTRVPRMSSQFLNRVFKRRKLDEFEVTEFISNVIPNTDV